MCVGGGGGARWGGGGVVSGGGAALSMERRRDNVKCLFNETFKITTYMLVTQNHITQLVVVQVDDMVPSHRQLTGMWAATFFH